MSTKDFEVTNHGSIFLLQPLSREAREWIDAHTDDAPTWGGAVVVEHRFIADIVNAMMEDGLTTD